MSLAANGEGPDQTAHPRSLIWAFAVRASPECTFSVARLIYKVSIRITFTSAGSRGPDQPAHPRNVIRAFAGRLVRVSDQRICISKEPSEHRGKLTRSLNTVRERPRVECICRLAWVFAARLIRLFSLFKHTVLIIMYYMNIRNHC